LLLAVFSYVFLIDQALYLNHFYLTIIFLFLMACVPAHSTWSLDAKNNQPQSIPKWALWALLIQLEVVLLYAGIVKLNEDWLALEPLSHWLTSRKIFQLLVGYFHI
jgi:vitamin K-dependent gamma-carboxylase